MHRGDGDGSEERPGLRERKKRATRDALSSAAIRLALEQGFDNLRVEDIAGAAGVSPRTFNNYFSSREQAICAARVAQMERIAEALLARPAEEPLLDAITGAMLAEQPREPLREDFRLFTSNPALHGEFLRTAAQTTSPLIEAIARRTGTQPSDMLPHVTAVAVFGAMRAAMRQWLNDDDPPPYTTLLRDALNHLRALSAAVEASASDGGTPGATPADRTAPDGAVPSASAGISPASARPSIIDGWAA